MADSIYKWSTTAASNDSADSIVNWRENQLPDTVNDSARSMMKRIAEFRDDLTGGLVTAGTQPAYTLTTSAQFDSLSNGRLLTCRIHATNTGPATFNVNTLGAKKIRKYGSTGDMDLGVGDLQLNGVYQMMYSAGADSGAGAWIINNPSLSTGGGFASGTALIFAQAASPVGWTKSATQDDKALRVVSGTTGGTAGGGTKTFSQCFSAARTATGTVDGHALTWGENGPHYHNQQGYFNTGQQSADHYHYVAVNGNTGGRSAQHNHGPGQGGGFVSVNAPVGNIGSPSGGSGLQYGGNTAGETQEHTHGISIGVNSGGISAGHYHGVTISGGTDTQGNGTPHTHTFTSAAMDFAVQYLDTIVCIKD